MNTNFSFDEKIPPLTWVVLSIDEKSVYGPYVGEYETKLGAINNTTLLLCLGEITNQKNHYALVNATTGQVVCGFHADVFRLPTGEEI